MMHQTGKPASWPLRTPAVGASRDFLPVGPEPTRVLTGLFHPGLADRSYERGGMESSHLFTFGIHDRHFE
jgi:hypothetical protein